MKIDDACIRLEAAHEYERRISISSESRFSFKQVLQDSWPKASEPPGNMASVEEPVADPEAQRRLRLLSLLQELLADIIARLSGENCRRDPVTPASAATPLEVSEVSGRRPLRIIEWQRKTTERIEESEKTAISASGEVHTGDGRRIAFDLQLNLCRSFECTLETETSGRIELKDPLVINFAGRAAELSGQSFRFDLDADGQAELLPDLATGNGFLAFDADCDGRIADGRELFGATGQHAGNGFADLARLDHDSNGWIDEADPAFAALGVWFSDGQLKTLREAGVGALHLGSADSPFALKDAANETRGQIRKTGIFLNENGSVGALQQLDLGVRTEEDESRIGT